MEPESLNVFILIKSLDLKETSGCVEMCQFPSFQGHSLGIGIIILESPLKLASLDAVMLLEQSLELVCFIVNC